MKKSSSSKFSMKLLRSIYLKSSVIQQVRPHVGQRRVAERLRSLLHSSVYPSEIAGKYRPCVYLVNLLFQTDEQETLVRFPWTNARKKLGKTS